MLQARFRTLALTAWTVLLSPFPASPLELDSGALHLELDPADGRIVALASALNGHNLVDPEAAAPLWQIDLPGPDGEPLVPARAAAFDPAPHGDNGLRLVWSRFNLDNARDLRVTVAVALDGDVPLSRWSIAVEGLGGLRPVSVRFPRVGGLARQENESLAVPVWMGERTEQARDMLNAGGQGRRFEWEYPGLLSMQCLAFYRDGGPGFYAATDDTEAFSKRFALFGDGAGGAGFEVVQLPEGGGAGGAYRAPYRVVLGAFEGDWFTAAERYREWALQQSWARQSRLRNGATPAWAVDTGLWVWNRGRSENVLGPATALREAAGVPVSVFWHWWHGCAYDVGFPEYLPPREGAEPFRDAVATARGRGLEAIVYMNQRLWGMTAPSWETRGAARYAVKGPDGSIRPEVYNTFTKSPCASMCMGTAFWRDTYAGLATEAVTGLGVGGIYMDQACSSLACFDPAHGHPVGGGTYWIHGFQALQGDIRARCAAGGRAVTLAGEGCGEAWLPYLDLMLSLQVSMERYAAPGQWQPIPFFHAAYHGHFIAYGNYASLTMPPYDELWPAEFAPEEPLALLDRKYATQFRMEQARAFVWGQQPTVANFRPEHLESRAEEMDFVIRLARLRQRAAPFLLHGTMLRAPAVDVPAETIPMSRLSIYAGQQGALSEFSGEYPLLLVSAWEAPGGGVAVVAANAGDTPRRLAFTLDAAEYPLPRRGTVRTLLDTGNETETPHDGPALAIEAELPPASARVHIITRE